MLEQLKLLYHLILRHCLLGGYWFKLTYQGLAKFMKIQYKLFKLETVLLSLNLFCFKTFSILILRFFCRLIKIVCNRLTSSINCYKLITYSTLFSYRKCFAWDVQIQWKLCWLFSHICTCVKVNWFSKVVVVAWLLWLLVIFLQN